MYSHKPVSLIGCMCVVLSQIRFRDWLHGSCTLSNSTPWLAASTVGCTLTNWLPWLAAWELYSHKSESVNSCMWVVLSHIPFRDWLAASAFYSHTSASVIGCMWDVLSHICFRHLRFTLTNPFPWLAACELYSHTSASVIGCMWVVLLLIRFRLAACDFILSQIPFLDWLRGRGSIWLASRQS
jgi:hypothetical protein